LSKTLKVGVLDSGAGGLTVLSAILGAKRNIELHYFADDAFSPYGSLSVSDIQDRVIKVCLFLINKGVSALVIACNTATLEAVSLVRCLPEVKENNIIVVGIEPAIKPASLLNAQGVVSVLATPVSCKSSRLQILIQNSMPNPSLSLTDSKMGYHCIESDVLARAIDAMPEKLFVVEQELQRIKGIMQDLNSRVLVLACTHYPLIKSMFTDLFDYPISIIEPSEAVANRLFFLIDQSDNEGLLSTNKGYNQRVCLYSSGDCQALRRLTYWLKALLGGYVFDGLDLSLNTACIDTLSS